MIVSGAEGTTDIDRRLGQGSRIEFNAPSAVVQRIKVVFGVKRVDPEGWIATGLWGQVWKRHTFLRITYSL